MHMGVYAHAHTNTPEVCVLSVVAHIYNPGIWKDEASW